MSDRKNEEMQYITDKLSKYNIKYEIFDDNALRAYGNFSGYTIIRSVCKGCVNVDRENLSYSRFERWLKRVRL